MTAKLEKGGGTFRGIKMLLCENPLPPLDEAIAAAQAELPCSNYYTEPYSEPLRRFLAEQIDVPERLIHINAGSELILRQLFDRLGQQVHLLTHSRHFLSAFPSSAAAPRAPITNPLKAIKVARWTKRSQRSVQSFGKPSQLDPANLVLVQSSLQVYDVPASGLLQRFWRARLVTS